jgi:hypothetical protein
MARFAIIEVDDGFNIIELLPEERADDMALKAGGILADPGPYASYEDACDALDLLEEDDR